MINFFLYQAKRKNHVKIIHSLGAQTHGLNKRMTLFCLNSKSHKPNMAILIICSSEAVLAVTCLTKRSKYANK